MADVKLSENEIENSEHLDKLTTGDNISAKKSALYGWYPAGENWVRIQTDENGVVQTSGGSALWGDITGTLSNQTDLQSALNALLPLTGGTLAGALTISAGSSAGTINALDISASANYLNFLVTNNQPANTSNQANFIMQAVGSGGTAYVFQFQTSFNDIVTNNSLISMNGFSDGSFTSLLQLDGVYVSFYGPIFPVQATTVSAPSYVKGGIYFDTTLNKLRIGGATAWETVTSA